MKQRMDESTLVLAGQWNIRIFRPEWVVQHLLEGKPVEAEVLVVPGENHIRLVEEDLILIPKYDRFIIGVKNWKDDALVKAEALARNVVTLLCHTPLQGIGFNFGFEEEEPKKALLDIFGIKDMNRLSDFGGRIVSTEIKRSLQFDEVKDCTVTLKLSLENEKVRVHLNYHQKATSAEVAIPSLGGRFCRYRDYSLELLKTVYDLTLDVEDQDEGGVLRTGAIN